MENKINTTWVKLENNSLEDFLNTDRITGDVKTVIFVFDGIGWWFNESVDIDEISQ